MSKMKGSAPNSAGIYSVDDTERATHLLAIMATHSGAKSDAVIQGRSVMVRSELAINSMLAYAAERVFEATSQGPRAADDLRQVINAWLAKDCDWGEWEKALDALVNPEPATPATSA